MKMAAKRKVVKTMESDVLNYFSEIEKKLNQIPISFEKKRELVSTIQKGKKSYQNEVERRKQTERKNMELIHEIELAKKDELTGTMVKSYFERIKERFIDYSIVLMDLNNLKFINDKYGHLIGNLYIKQFVNTLKNHLRETDLIVRYGGGDEFLLLIPKEDKVGIEELINRLSKKIIETPFIYQGKKHVMSCAFGACIHEKMDIDAKITIADKNMYQHKKWIKKQVRRMKIRSMIKNMLEVIFENKSIIKN